MKSYRGSEKSPKGVYMNVSKFEFVQVGDLSPVLPGDRDTKYLKVPPVMAMVTGPFAGLAFIVFLPFVGIIGVIGFIGYKLWHGLVGLERRTVSLVSFSWQPGRASFSPRSRTPEAKRPEDKKELAELEDEIARRKEQGEH